MARKVIWTESAWNDLEESANYISRDSPYYAAGFVHEVREAARILSAQAQIGRVAPELNSPDIRELIVRNYRLIYQIEEEAVYIIGFIHGARDLTALWKREGQSRLGEAG